MKTRLFLSFGLLGFAICNVTQVSAQNTGNSIASTTKKLSQADKEERNKKIALANAEAIHVGDVAAASKNLPPDIINYGNGNIPPQKGKEAVTASLRMFIGAFPIDKIDNVVAVAD